VGPLFIALAGVAAVSLPASAHDATAPDADKILAAMTDNFKAQPMLSADYDANYAPLRSARTVLHQRMAASEVELVQ